MDLRNWETFTISGLAVVGANVEVREATLTHPNTTAVLATTVTDANGMWEFLGLSDTPKDVKITYLGKVKWLKGNTRHSIDIAQGSAYVPSNQNLLKNGGFETWRLGPTTNYAIGGSAIAPIASGWHARTGAGDSANIGPESSIVMTDSKFSCRAIYTKSAGFLYILEELPIALVYGLRQKTVCVSLQARQGVPSNAQAVFINDSGETLGATVATTGTFVTLSCQRSFGPSMTFCRVGVKVLASDTVYLDDGILTIGAGVPTHVPRPAGEETDQQTYEMQDRMYTRQFILGAN